MNMTENNEWKIFKWHCENCGHMVQGLKNKEGRIKVKYNFCHSIMVRVPKSRRTDDFHVTAPNSAVHV